MKPLAAVTGGTGFLGRHVLTALTEAGWRLRLLVRSDPDLEAGECPVDLIPGDLSDDNALRALCQGADAVIHIAGAIKGRTRADFMQVNEAGTRAVASAWRAGGVSQSRFVLLSSLAAREPGLSYYAASKAAAEVAARQTGDAGRIVILRPSAIYGPGDRETLAVFKAARLPVHPLLNGPEARLTLIHVRDVARAVSLAADGTLPTGCFELTDATTGGYRWADVVGTACAAVGRSRRAFRVPSMALRGVGKLGDLGAALTGSAEMVTSQKTREILHSDWSSLPEEQPPSHLWRAEIPLDEGFSSTVSWYRDAGWLPRET
ncbi:MAG: NAD(P)-dependent oxidoreductase [Pseudomonadota bacterium]